VHSTGDAVESVLSKRQQGSDTFSTHLMTQVNRFKDKAITGKGIKIGIIDTGVSRARRGGAFQRVPDVSLTETDRLPPPCPWWLLRRGLPGLVRHRPSWRRVQWRQHTGPGRGPARRVQRPRHARRRHHCGPVKQPVRYRRSRRGCHPGLVPRLRLQRRRWQ
jgi:hypothetical protein